MRAVIQRVSQAAVTVGTETVGQIADGLLVLLGVADGDDAQDVDYLSEKVVGLRIFEDADGKMNRSVIDTGGAVLVVSQFTLLGDVRRGRRPSFTVAAAPEQADQLYQAFCAQVEQAGLDVQRGRFQADMQVALVNDGPVTILLDSKKLL